MAKQDDYIRTALRVPPELHAKIHASAEDAGRTFNAEIVQRLQESFEPRQMVVDLGGHTEEFSREIAKVIASHLKGTGAKVRKAKT